MGQYNSEFDTFSRCSVSLFKKYQSAFTLLVFLFVFSVGTAWSYVYDDDYTDFNSVSHETLKFEKRSSSAAGDVCTPLLNTLHHTPPTLSTARSQRSVGKIAALGMMLGARFALEPKLQDNASVLNVDAILEHHVKVTRKPALHSAQTIAAYRTCLKNQALAQNTLTK